MNAETLLDSIRAELNRCREAYDACHTADDNYELEIADRRYTEALENFFEACHSLMD